MPDDLSDEETEAPRVHRIQNGPPQTSTSELAAGISRWMDASNSFLYVELSSLVLLFACVADWYGTVWQVCFIGGMRLLADMSDIANDRVLDPGIPAVGHR